MSWQFYLALVTFLVLFAINFRAIQGLRTIKSLKDISLSDEKSGLPKVSIMLATMNNEETIEDSVNALIQTQYENFEIIVINDRSTDQTGDILARLQQQTADLKICNIEQLPSGWLGKNHALHVGSKVATGDYILFIDGQSILHPTCVSRAVRYMVENKLDHISTTYGLKNSTLWVKTYLSDMTLDGFKTSKPCRAIDSSSRSFIGNGKFNMVKADKYRDFGGHEAIKMCIIDDQMLGMYMKFKGGRQDMLWGEPMIMVDWYKTTYAFVRGVEKHAFPGMAYSLVATTLVSFMAIVFHVYPMIAVFLTDGVTQMLNILIVVMRVFVFQYLAIISNGSIRNPMFSLFSPLVGIWVLWNSAIRFIINKGISWKDTHYSIDELKTCQFPEFKN